MPVLTLLDLLGIQGFVFGSERLRENLGGSFLVDQVLTDWLRDECDVPQDVLWAGGGNAAMRSPDRPTAIARITRLSARIAERAPGLYLACAHVDWDGASGSYGKAAGLAGEHLLEAKSTRPVPAGFDGGGVVMPCGATGHPAVAMDAKDKERPIGRAVHARWNAWGHARDRLASFYTMPKGLSWTQEIDNLGRDRGDESAYAVIHLDGNGMGARFREESTKSLAAVQALSKHVNQLGEATLRSGLNWVSTRIQDGHWGSRIGGFALNSAEEGKAFPVRPVIYGGDDLTLICDARLAHDLTAHLLEQWNKQSGDLGAHACAGIAIVGPHAPFSRAVALAEKLCRRAKDYLRERELLASAMDWEICREGVPDDLDTFREGRTINGQSLVARPYVVVGSAPLEHRKWSWFRWTLLWTFRWQGGLLEAHPEGKTLEEGNDRHTRLKGLAEILTEGPAETRRHLARWRMRDEYRLPNTGRVLEEDGFVSGETPYLDAVELMDLLAVAKGVQ